MSDQEVTEPENPCITSVAKSLGQVGYEAMLAAVVADPNIAGHDAAPPEWWVENARVWENQPAKLREDWESVAAAIAKEASPLLYHECLRLKAVQP